jgi:chromate transporter
MKSRLKDIFILFFTFLKIGAFTFGGGYAMIPLIEREIIDNRKYIEKKEVLDIIAVSASMPGAIAINIATFIGYRVAGYAGSIASILGCVLPSFCIIYAC